jgi:hypothetical protein
VQLDYLFLDDFDYLWFVYILDGLGAWNLLDNFNLNRFFHEDFPNN